jgi:tetratricopeptide (TPR) repeat protein
LIYQKYKYTKKALYYYQKAEKINKAYPLIYLNRGNLFSAQGLFDKAILEYLKTIQYDEGSAGAYANLGYALLMKGETDGAIQNLEIGHKLGVNNVRIFRLLGHAYRKKKAYSQAYLMFVKAQALNPKDPLTLLYLTELYAYRGMTIKCNEVLKSLFKSFGDDVPEMKRFLEEIFGSGKIKEALLPELNNLSSLLAQECRLRGQAYQDLADFLSSR